MDEHDGLRAMRIEMARQCGDALASLDSARPAAAEVAASLRRTGRLVLYGMGGSHFVGRALEPLYRDLGLDARALTASEALISPLPDLARTALTTSQSGRSGEIVDLIARPAGQEERFALTLDGDSPLAAASRASLVGAGGPEQAFAATRSVIVTLALHGAVLEALGQPQTALRSVLAEGRVAEVAAAEAALAPCEVIVLAGRHVMQGVAESATLSLMELPRVAAIAFEGGQFRHGPFELLRPGIGVILPRSAGPDRGGVAELAAASAEAGCPVVLLDAGGGEGLPGCVRLELTPGEGLAAAVSALLTMQRLSIALAKARVKGPIGTPLRTSKVTI